MWVLAIGRKEMTKKHLALAHHLREQRFKSRHVNTDNIRKKDGSQLTGSTELAISDRCDRFF